MSRPSVRVGVVIVAAMLVGFVSLAVLGARQSSDPNILRARAQALLGPASGPAAFAPAYGGTDLLVLQGSGEMSRWDLDLGRRQPVRNLEISSSATPHLFASSRRHLVVGDFQSLRVYDQSGTYRRSFAVPLPSSVAILPNGDVVVAAPTVLGLLHVYSALAVNRGSFGELKTIDSDPAENSFLNRGIVFAGSGGDIFYVSRFAPVPFVKRFGANGRQLAEFTVGGSGIVESSDRASSFLASRSTGTVGGMDVITSAAFDRSSGHLWFAATGGPATVYEYTADGTKLAEYIVTDMYGNALGFIKQIAVVRGVLYVLEGSERLHAFEVPRRTALNTIGRVLRRMLTRTGGEAVLEAQTGPCGPDVPLGTCNVPCTAGVDKNCDTVLAPQLPSSGYNKEQVTCTRTATSCNLQVKLCRLSNHVRSTTGVSNWSALSMWIKTDILQTSSRKIVTTATTR